MDKKIIELEEKLAHFEHTIEALNNVVFRQTQKIDELEEILKHLSMKIRQSNDTQESHHITTNNQPPHY
ncbi:MAG: hypothetical protein Rsou_1388 [Candidatus Ruthia sp. Asou_11_S2]|nr:hypothetical protein [Candidatus Ruthia sp. Asou_11_S2]